MTKLKFDLGKMYLPLVKIHNIYVFSMIRLCIYPLLKPIIAQHQYLVKQDFQSYGALELC